MDKIVYGFNSLILYVFIDYVIYKNINKDKYFLEFDICICKEVYVFQWRNNIFFFLKNMYLNYYFKFFDFQDFIFNKCFFFIKKIEMFFYKKGNYFCY